MNILRTRDVKPVAPKIAKPKPATRADLRKKAKEGRERFLRARKAETQYRRQLIALAKETGRLINGLAPGGIVTPQNAAAIDSTLNQYAEITKPWARAVAARMLADVDNRDKAAWKAHAAEMGQLMRAEIATAPTGQAMRELLELQVGLITSIPREAAERVQKLAIEGLSTGKRASVIQSEIMRSGEVAKHRAETIARTETARASTTLTMVRAQSVGAESYIWRSTLDGTTRPLHRKLNGNIFRWDAPPVTGENGERSHPGCIYQCRCYSEPILPDVL